MDEAGPAVLELFKRLQQRVQEEEKLTKELTLISGQIEMLLAAATISDHQINDKSELPTLAPSSAAQQNLILNV